MHNCIINDIWDSVSHILRKRAMFEEIRAFFVETDNFGPKTLGRCSSYVSEALGAWYSWKKRRSVHQNTSKITVPAGLARHVRSKKCESLFIILTHDCGFSHIAKVVPTGLARTYGFWTAEIVTHRISWPPLRKPSPSQPNRHEEGDSLTRLNTWSNH